MTHFIFLFALLANASAFAASRSSYNSADEFFNQLSDQRLASSYRERLVILENLFGKREIRSWRVDSRLDYQPGTRSISVPLTVGNGTIDEAVAIFTHEYAHVIAEDYVMSSLPGWRKVVADLEHNIPEMETLKESLKEGAGLPQLRAYTVLRSRVALLEAKTLVLHGYQEFIADVFAVVLANDNDVMANAITHQFDRLPGFNPVMGERRSFALDLTSATALTASPNIDPYDKFLATRVWFGKQPYAERYLRDPQFLKKILLATMKAANRQLEKPMTVEQLNMNLQRSLKTVFR